MCSNLEEGLVLPEKRSLSLPKSKTCLKCENAAVVMVKIKDGYCRDCFMSYAVHKFRMSFGKSKLVRDQERVILAFSGGNNSSAMLHLVQEGKSERAQKKLRFMPTIVYIDESCVLNSDETEAMKAIINTMSQTGHQYAVYQLSQVFKEKVEPVISTNQTEEDVTLICDRLQQKCSVSEDTRVNGLISSAKSLSAKQNILHNLRFQLLYEIARYHGCSKVLLGDTCTNLAVNMLSNITQGGGAHLSYQVGFADTRRSDVTFLRPMREFSNKEVAMYNAFNKVESVVMPNLLTKAPGNSSLYRLTEEFVNGLQQDYPNTVSTIFRTGEKLDVDDKKNRGAHCCMCQAPLDTAVDDCSALRATMFSEQLGSRISQTTENLTPDTSVVKSPVKYSDEGTPNAVTSPGDHVDAGDCVDVSSTTSCCGQGDGSCHSTSSRLSVKELTSALCYSCRLVVKDLNDYTALPGYILQSAGKQVRRSQMRASIEEFLLEDS